MAYVTSVKTEPEERSKGGTEDNESGTKAKMAQHLRANLIRAQNL